MQGRIKVGGPLFQALFGTVALLPVLGACSLGTDPSSPEWARVVVTATSTFRVERVVSQRFLVTEGSVQLMEATVDSVSVPFEKRYTLSTPARFFVRITNTSQQTVTLNMEVFLEERSWMDDEKTLPPGEKVEFVYRYDMPTPNG
jgi:hypothetical protein